MGRTFKHDESKVHKGGHKWVFQSAYAQEWGATVSFYCANAGCPTKRSLPVEPTKNTGFDEYCVNADELEEIDE